MKCKEIRGIGVTKSRITQDSYVLSADGKQFGRPRRPSALNVEERAAVVERLGTGVSIAELACEFKTTRKIMMRVMETALLNTGKLLVSYQCR